MKKLIVVVLLLVAVTLQAQEWQTDLSLAQKIAKEKHQPIVLVFQGSDWCTPCIKLDRAIWSTDEFKKYAKTHYVMLQADFPRKKKNRLPEAQQAKNNKLAETYNSKGYFPHVVVIDANGKMKGETGYNKYFSVQDYINWINSVSKN